MFAAEALTLLIKEKAGDDYDQRQEEREKLFKLGELMADRWPGDKAGEFGRFIVVMHLIKKPLPTEKPTTEKSPNALMDFTRERRS